MTKHAVRKSTRRVGKVKRGGRCVGRPMKNVNKYLQEGETYRKAIGNAAEDYVGEHLPCPECHRINWVNLNTIKKHYPGVDLECRQCDTRVQIKARALKPNGDCPFTNMDGEWGSIKMSASRLTLRDTLSKRKHPGKVRFIGVVYNMVNDKYIVRYIAVTEPLRQGNIVDDDSAIVSYNTLWHE